MSTDGKQHRELHESPALDSYAKWRPRLKRGATWAGTAAFLSKTVGGDAKGMAHIAIPTIAAGLAGMGDATLEEKLRANARNKKAAEIINRGFEERHMSSTKKASAEDASLFPDAAVEAAEREANIVVTGLSRQRDAQAQRASAQLRDYFPDAGRQQGSYGRGLRLTTGNGSIAQLLAGTR